VVLNCVAPCGCGGHSCSVAGVDVKVFAVSPGAVATEIWSPSALFHEALVESVPICCLCVRGLTGDGCQSAFAFRSTCSPKLLFCHQKRCVSTLARVAFSPSNSCACHVQGAQTSLFAALKEPLSGGLYFSPYMGTRSAPDIFDYWSIYGEPR
jgi:hypothetical protein